MAKYEYDVVPAKLGPDGKEIRPARTVVLKELTSGEFEQMLKTLTDREKSDPWELVNQGLRRTIVRDGKEELNQTKLLGSLLTDRFGVKELDFLRRCFEDLHSLKEEDLVRVRTPRVIAD